MNNNIYMDFKKEIIEEIVKKYGYIVDASSENLRLIIIKNNYKNKNTIDNKIKYIVKNIIKNKIINKFNYSKKIYINDEDSSDYVWDEDFLYGLKEELKNGINIIVEKHNTMILIEILKIINIDNDIRIETDLLDKTDNNFYINLKEEREYLKLILEENHNIFGDYYRVIDRLNKYNNMNNKVFLLLKNIYNKSNKKLEEIEKEDLKEKELKEMNNKIRELRDKILTV